MSKRKTLVEWNNELVGKTFERLTVKEVLQKQDPDTDKNIGFEVLCQCSCGKEKTVALNSLIYGLTRSCGCLKKGPRKSKTNKELNEELSVENKEQESVVEPNIKIESDNNLTFETKQKQEAVVEPREGFIEKEPALVCNPIVKPVIHTDFIETKQEQESVVEEAVINKPCINLLNNILDTWKKEYPECTQELIDCLLNKAEEWKPDTKLKNTNETNNIEDSNTEKQEFIIEDQAPVKESFNLSDLCLLENKYKPNINKSKQFIKKALKKYKGKEDLSTIITKPSFKNHSIWTKYKTKKQRVQKETTNIDSLFKDLFNDSNELKNAFDSKADPIIKKNLESIYKPVVKPIVEQESINATIKKEDTYHKEEESVCSKECTQVKENKVNRYLKIVHRGRGVNVRVELPNGETQVVPVDELKNWECIGTEEEAKKEPSVKKERKPKEEKKTEKKSSFYKKKVNGVGIDHPYESINMYVETVEYSDGIEAPF